MDNSARCTVHDIAIRIDNDNGLIANAIQGHSSASTRVSTRTA